MSICVRLFQVVPSIISGLRYVVVIVVVVVVVVAVKMEQTNFCIVKPAKNDNFRDPKNSVAFVDKWSLCLRSHLQLRIGSNDDTQCWQLVTNQSGL